MFWHERIFIGLLSISISRLDLTTAQPYRAGACIDGPFVLGTEGYYGTQGSGSLASGGYTVYLDDKELVDSSTSFIEYEIYTGYRYSLRISSMFAGSSSSSSADADGYTEDDDFDFDLFDDEVLGTYTNYFREYMIRLSTSGDDFDVSHSLKRPFACADEEEYYEDYYNSCNVGGTILPSTGVATGGMSSCAEGESGLCHAENSTKQVFTSDIDIENQKTQYSYPGSLEITLVRDAGGEYANSWYYSKFNLKIIDGENSGSSTHSSSSGSSKSNSYKGDAYYSYYSKSGKGKKGKGYYSKKSKKYGSYYSDYSDYYGDYYYSKKGGKKSYYSSYEDDYSSYEESEDTNDSIDSTMDSEDGRVNNVDDEEIERLVNYISNETPKLHSVSIGRPRKRNGNQDNLNNEPQYRRRKYEKYAKSDKQIHKQNKSGKKR